jgi:hypothetical protein
VNLVPSTRVLLYWRGACVICRVPCRLNLHGRQARLMAACCVSSPNGVTSDSRSARPAIDNCGHAVHGWGRCRRTQLRRKISGPKLVASDEPSPMGPRVGRHSSTHSVRTIGYSEGEDELEDMASAEQEGCLTEWQGPRQPAKTTPAVLISCRWVSMWKPPVLRAVPSPQRPPARRYW